MAKASRGFLFGDWDDRKRSGVFVRPSLENVAAYCQERQNGVDPAAFFDFYESKGWTIGRSPMKDWRAAVRTWERNNYGTGKAAASVLQRTAARWRDDGSLDREHGT